VADQVTQDGHDRHQLHNMTTQAKEALAVDALEVVVDRGYFKGEEVLACDEDNITTFLHRPLTFGSIKKGLHTKRDFMFRPDDDEYECPAGERLIYRFTTEEKVRRSTNAGRRTAQSVQSRANIQQPNTDGLLVGNMKLLLMR